MTSRAQRLRVVLCTRGGLFGARVLERLRSCERLEVCALVRSCRILDPRLGTLRGTRELIRRSGLDYSLYLLCATTLADLLGGITPAGGVPSRSRALLVHTTADVNSADGLGFLAASRADVLVSAFFDQRLHEPALAIPQYGCINIHPSLLPAFGGVDPVLQARLARAPVIGVTVHRMVPELDRGPILAQRTVELPADASVFAATARLYTAGAELLVAALDRIERHDAGRIQESPRSYQSWPTASDVRALRAQGGRLMRLTDLAAFSAPRRPPS